MAWYHRAQVGDRIVCIRNHKLMAAPGWKYSNLPYKPIVGNIYSITEISTFGQEAGGSTHPAVTSDTVIIRIDIKYDPKREVWWLASYFKPLDEIGRDTDISIFTKLLNTKQKELEDV